jgi:hypothetical protein
MTGGELETIGVSDAVSRKWPYLSQDAACLAWAQA